MKSPDELIVRWDKKQVGTLARRNDGTMVFRYCEEWLNSDCRPISQSLPIGDHDFNQDPARAHRFFANLLPEGGFRESIVRQLGIPNSDFDLLFAIGRDCAGALSISTSESQISTKSSYLKIEDDQFLALIQSKGEFASQIDPIPPRLSLAGAQSKTSVLFRDGSFFRPLDSAPSTHILKFEYSDFKHVPAYEVLVSKLARMVGLRVVNIRLQEMHSMRFSISERYDRVISSNGEVLRLHQEDFCQALGLSHNQKYQEHNGPCFADCVHLIREVSSFPQVDLLQLLDWQIMNAIVGNSDGHAKNISLLYSEDGTTQLAPFYDMVSTRAIANIDHRLAFSIGGEFNPKSIRRSHWHEFAKECDIRASFVVRRVEETINAVLKHMPVAFANFEDSYGPYPALQRVEQVIVDQAKRLLN